MYKPKVAIPITLSLVAFLPKLLNVSTQTAGNTIRLITGIKSKRVHQLGLFMIFIKTIALYTGIAASQLFLPAATYNFHVPIK